MGYTITVGELRVQKDPEDGIEPDCLSFRADGAGSPDAPAFGNPTDRTNSLWPSYTAWAETMRISGLTDAFFYQGSMIGGHPGVRLVTPELVETVTYALRGLEAKNPNAKAEYGTDVGAAMCRLIWLDYWLRWAIENCETPVIANS